MLLPASLEEELLVLEAIVIDAVLGRLLNVGCEV